MAQPHTRRRIMMVDDNEANLAMGKNMLRTFYDVYPLLSAKKLFELLDKVAPDLILLDIQMPDMSGYDTIRKLKADARFADTPVIFLTAMTDEGSELEGLSLGACDYIYKPFSAALLLKRIENQLTLSDQRQALEDYSKNLEEKVMEKTSQILDLRNAVMDVVAEIVEYRDDATGGHVYRTQRYIELLCKKLLETGLYAQETRDWNLSYLVPSAQLHDVGKIGIPDCILKKPGPLTTEEFDEMKDHTIIGVEIIERIEENTEEHDFLRHAKVIAGTHHEWWDGSGYPMGLMGTMIPLEGRLMAIADVYDALISRRPYKEPFTCEEANSIIEGGAGTHFDPELVELFKELEPAFKRIAREFRQPSAVLNQAEWPHTEPQKAASAE
jgi:putative two-component system response regulator